MIKSGGRTFRLVNKGPHWPAVPHNGFTELSLYPSVNYGLVLLLFVSPAYNSG